MEIEMEIKLSAKHIWIMKVSNIFWNASESSFLTNSAQYFVVLCIFLTVASFAHCGTTGTHIGCLDTGEKICQMNETCELICNYTCCKNRKNRFFVYGSVAYSSNSSVCRAALHDLRISLDKEKSRKVTIQRYKENNCSLEHSVNAGFSTSAFNNESCSLFKFVSPRISEKLLDVVSMHSNFLYGENQTHIQTCAIASNAINQSIAFETYSTWSTTICNWFNKTRRQADNPELFKQVWSQPSSTAGYQCIPSETDLSIITSIAFQKNASFLPEALTVTTNKYENIVLTMHEIQNQSTLQKVWKKDNEILNSASGNERGLILSNVTESSSGIYSLAYENPDIAEAGFIQLIVRACPSGKFGDDCTNTCPVCLNGGICHDITGECLCAPGFNGTKCEKACQPGYVGKICNIKCSEEHSNREELCKGLLICLPKPYGCSCASGFTGLNCTIACPSGFYGAGCKQQHEHKQYKEETCSRYYSECECLRGWHGELCNESYPVLKTVPNLLNATVDSIAISFSKWSKAKDMGTGVPAWYEVVYKEPNNDEWIVGANITDMIEKQEYDVEITNLTVATTYSIGVIVVDKNNNKQESNISTIAASTACDIPSKPPSDVKLSSAIQHIYVNWMLPPKDSWNCREISSTVKVKERSSDCEVDCLMIDNSSCSFYSDPQDSWIIEVCVYANGTAENCAKPKIISADSSSFASPIDVIITKKKTAVSLSWKTPRFYSKMSHYVIKYFDVDTNVSESIQVDIQDTQCEGNKPEYQCCSVENLLPGHEYKFEIIAFMKNINEGRKLESFTVCLEKHSTVAPIVLGFIIPLVLIIVLIILIVFLQRKKKRKSAMKVKFLPHKLESELGTCNEALDEMEIIETESMCEEISNPINLDELQEFVKQGLQNVKIRKEFMSVPTGQIYPCNIAKLGENKPKNRYGNILPYDHSRVILDTVNGDPFSNYIHASYIHGYSNVKKYIATQGPLSNTVNDFWRMVWNEGCCKILMIANFVENGKCKCEKYWSDTSCIYGEIEVTLEDSKSYADYIVKTFRISKDKSIRTLKLFHFTTWPDHGAPFNSTPFIDYLQRARTYKPELEAPIIVHCSAGIGRTGATILLDSMIDMALQEKKVDVVSHLCGMRKQRMNIVENFDQYVFVYCAIAEIFSSEETSVQDSNFKKELEMLRGFDKVADSTYLEKQFKALSTLNIGHMGKDLQGAYDTENQNKNRSMLILPPDRGRPLLSRDSGSGYINAVFVDSFTVKNAYIATQYPLPDTVNDFWSMVYEQKSRIVVLLQEIDTSIENMPLLWSPEGTRTYGEFEVTCQSVSLDDEMTVVDVLLSSTVKDHKEPLSVNIIIIKNWAMRGNLPAGVPLMLCTLLKVFSLNDKPSSTITIVCPDGATSCGILCASLYICDQIRAEGVVDVFHAVKCIRTNRPQFIVDSAQYEFLFEVISSYLDILQNDLYL